MLSTHLINRSSVEFGSYSLPSNVELSERAWLPLVVDEQRRSTLGNAEPQLGSTTRAKLGLGVPECVNCASCLLRGERLKCEPEAAQAWPPLGSACIAGRALRSDSNAPASPKTGASATLFAPNVLYAT